ncbi:MAG: hypothetical protein ACQEP7_01445 [bacterium]
MPDSRMGKRKKLKGYVEVIYSGEKPLEFQAEDVSTNAIGIIVPLDHRVVDNIRKFFRKTATLKHPRLPNSVTGRLNRIAKVPGDRLKWLFSLNRKLKNFKSI